MTQKPLIFGLSGPTLSQEERKLFQENPVKGFILFKRNIVDSPQLTSLIKDLKSLYDYYKPLILIDQEGGRVARLKPPLIEKEYPASGSFGAIYDDNPEDACAQVYKNYCSIMEDLKNYQIDSPCAPVADLRYPWADKVIGDRSFGSGVQKVVDLGSAAIRGIAAQGGIAIIKHMPGHGRATCDSHDNLPVIDTPLPELQETDFEVFRQLATHNQDAWAMTAHIIYKVLDPKNPVTLSAEAINFIRKDIGFKGVLITDDICMHALHVPNCETYFFAKQLLDLLENEETSDPKYNAILAKLIDNKLITENTEPLQQTQQLRAALPQLKAIFTASVAKVAYEAEAAGCDIVLHCSGDLQEMTAICAVL